MALVRGTTEVLFHDQQYHQQCKEPAVLLSYCVTAMYALIRNIGVPSKVTAVPYKDLVNRVTAHFNPRPLKKV